MAKRFLPVGSLALATVITLAGAGSAVADKGEHGWRGDRSETRSDRFMTMFDQDGSGTVTRDEVEAVLRERMEKLDASGDGTVTRDEMVSMGRERGGAMAERRFERMADGADNIDLDRMAERAADRMWSRFKVDGDEITADDLEAMRPRRSRGGRH